MELVLNFLNWARKSTVMYFKKGSDLQICENEQEFVEKKIEGQQFVEKGFKV